MTLKPENLKQAVAQAALKYVAQANILGVGTGSTVNFLIDLLPSVKHLFESAVASSNATQERLKLNHISVSDLNTVGDIDVYIDGADEANMHRYLVKGRGGALTREKILAAASKKFVCIIDGTKKVNILGREAPVPVEVIPLARSYVARQIVKLGGDPVYREGFQTDNGNVILDVYNLKILNPIEMEQTLNNITGVVENGLFACRPADVLIVATSEGIEII